MIYFDNASTTKISQLGLDTYNEISKNCYYNCSSLHKGGLNANKQLQQARETILNSINGQFNDTLIFCSGATEANNMAVFGLAKKGARILTSMGEHPSIYNTFKMAKNNVVDFVPLAENGQVDITKFQELINENNYDFISIMLVNNETGAINDIAKLVEIAKSKNEKTIFHSDCVQAYGKIDVLVDNLGVDAISISSHKINGPKGIGALYVKNGLHLNPITFGGGQEWGLRSGTENLPAIVSFAVVAEDKAKNIKSNYEKVKHIKERIIEIFNQNNFDYKINGDVNGSPYILSISLKGVKGEVLLHKLEIDDILIGTGSACSSKSSDNRILNSMGNTKDEIMGNIRLSFGVDNTINEAELVANKIIEHCNYLRNI